MMFPCCVSCYLFSLRLQKHRGVADPLEIVGGEISNESILLCLDEFMVRVDLVEHVACL